MIQGTEGRSPDCGPKKGCSRICLLTGSKPEGGAGPEGGRGGLTPGQLECMFTGVPLRIHCLGQSHIDSGVQ